MATLHVLGDFGSPWEKQTAKVLESGLPDSWDVLASKQLVRQNSTRDIDFIVIGDHTVFVCEDKAWRGRITGTTSKWVLSGGEMRGSPLSQAEQTARPVSGDLMKAIPELKSAVAAAPQGPRGHPKVVRSKVILSHSETVSLAVDDVRLTGNVYRHSDVCDGLLAADADLGEEFSIQSWRDQVVAHLLSLPERPGRPSVIGAYAIEESLPPTGLATQYAARHHDGTSRVLKVYERAVVVVDDAEEASERNLLLREYEACRTLRESKRVPEVDSYFGWEEDAFWVVPVHPVIDGEPLHDLDPENADVVAIAQDAFAGLAELHAAGVTHRSLSDLTVWVRPGNSIVFTDLEVARLDDTLTLPPQPTLDEPDDEISQHRAPEARSNPRAAGAAADVYSLASVLVTWAQGGLDRDRPLVPLSPLEGLASALRDDPTDRPEVTELVALLQGSQEDPGEVIGPGSMIINGRYKVIRNLGSGATATAWLVRDEALEEDLTLKVLRGGAIDVATVKAEYQALRKLRGAPGIAFVLYAFLDEDPPKLLVEYVPGGNLRERSVDLRRDPELAWAVLDDLVAGLCAAHEHDVLHRDISPSNIIIPDESGAVAAKLIDFGLAGRAGSETGIGTPRYRAPEVDAGEDWTKSADVYALAVTMLETLTMRLPFHTDELGGYDKLRVVDPPEVPSHLAPLVKVLMSAAYPHPERRYANAAEFREAVRAAPRESDDAETTGEERINETVDGLRAVYRGSSDGNDGNRGLDTPFAHDTYVDSALDEVLTPQLLAADHRLVLLSGNPGDGKTAYLEVLGKALQDHGASEVERTKAGWTYRLGDRTFRAVFDASESHGDLTSDEMLAQALDPLVENPSDPYTVVVAINDGRLLQFFDSAGALEFQDLWRDIRPQVREGMEPRHGVVLVDLKQRSLVGRGQASTSLTERVLAKLTEPARWEACEGCSARSDCPIRYNALSLRPRVEDDPAARLVRLVHVSHLRRHRRATMRDLRSALAWAVTGDMSCSDVHREREAGVSLLRRPGVTYPDRVFAGHGSPDLLLDEWHAVDPARTPRPRLERILHRHRREGWKQYGPGNLDETSGRPVLPTMREPTRLAEDKRRYYFEGDAHLDPRSALPDPVVTLPYRYLSDALTAIEQGPTNELIDRLRLGASRIIGTAGFNRPGVAVAALESAREGGSVVKVLPPDEVDVEACPPTASIVETASDRLVIRHRGGQPSLALGLDQIELLLRAADGYLPVNEEARPLAEELATFADQLLRHDTNELVVIEPTGLTHLIRRSGATIEYVDQ